MSSVVTQAEQVAAEIADRLACPDQTWTLVGRERTWWPQSLAQGAAGVTLLHVERARTGHGSWDRAHRWLSFLARTNIDSSPSCHLHLGAPAVGFAVNHAARATGGYAHALARLDAAITTVVHHRLAAARERRQAGVLPELAEFDAIRGLAGLGAYLLARGSREARRLVRAVLAELVALTQPMHDAELPGWWSHLSPAGTPSSEFPEGHGNLGMAHGIAGPLALLALALRHGIAGPLALLALALRHGIAVDGQHEAIRAIGAWLDSWRQHNGDWAWWPYWITRDHLRGTSPVTGPGRPSWCYGTAGLARAQQLAALATGDRACAAWAERTLAATLTDPAGRSGITDASLCHGTAGLAHIALRARIDAVSNALDGVPEQLTCCVLTAAPDVVAETVIARDGIGLLDGAVGTALALHTAATADLPELGWDVFLLI